MKIEVTDLADIEVPGADAIIAEARPDTDVRTGLTFGAVFRRLDKQLGGLTAAERAGVWQELREERDTAPNTALVTYDDVTVIYVEAKRSSLDVLPLGLRRANHQGFKTVVFQTANKDDLPNPDSYIMAIAGKILVYVERESSNIERVVMATGGNGAWANYFSMELRDILRQAGIS